VDNLPDDLIKAHLAKILASKTFAKEERCKTFLGFVVEQTLARRSSELKEVVIGTEAFDLRDFDPKENSFVRSNAARLRTRLEDYYKGEGEGDEILILLPKGGYVPQFQRMPRVSPIAPQPDARKPVNGSHETMQAAPPRALRFRRVAIGCALAMAGMAGLLVLRFLTQPGNQIAIRRPSSRYGSLLVRSSSKGKIIPRLDVGHEIGWLFVSPDGKLLYVVELFGRTITVIATEDGQIKRKLQLPQAANSAVMAKSGKRLYIGSANSVILYDLSLETVERTISTEFQVFDIAVTPDEKKLFVALGNDGLQRISLPSLESSSLSEFACPMHMAMIAKVSDSSSPTSAQAQVGNRGTTLLKSTMHSRSRDWERFATSRWWAALRSCRRMEISFCWMAWTPVIRNSMTTRDVPGMPRTFSIWCECLICSR